ncbi:MAG: ADOP family duplicated permease [Acidobacteriota bacterium]|jgi:predicted permease
MIPSPLRTALRRLARSPRLTAAAVVCIAVGTAATTAALTLVSATLLRPLPYPEADRLMRIWIEEPGGESRIAVSYPDLLDLSESLAGVDALEATARARMLFHSNDGDRGGTRRVEGEAVTPGYFRLLGVEPLLGRSFTAGEHRPGGRRALLIDHRTWGERFGYDPDVVGRTIRTDEGEHTVVGVLPASFTGTVEEDSGDIEFWVPIEQYLSPERRENRSIGGIWTLARLAPDRSADALGAELEALATRLAALYPDTHGGRTLTLEPMGENWRSGVRRGSLLLLAAAGLLLLVAAANVAVLLIARALGDRREIAIRAALGADRRRMIGQTLLETVLLVAGGSLLGLGLGPPLLRAVLDRPSLVDGSLLGIPVFVSLRLDPVAATLSCLVFLVTALVAGVGPAVLGARTDPGRALQEGARTAAGSRRSRRWTNALVLAEVALTTVLVIASALLVRSYREMQSEDLGFRTRDVLRIALFVNEQDVPDQDDLPGFYERVREELAAEPGVERVGVVWPTVPMDWPIQGRLSAPGLAGLQRNEAGGEDTGLRVGIFVADRAFFEVVEMPILAGRSFRTTDGADAPPVALVSRSLAQRLGQARDVADGEAPLRAAVGTEATLGGDPVRIVGVVDDVRFGGPREADSPAARYEIYLPFAQSPQRLLSLTLETAGDPEALVPPLTRRLAALAPASALDWIGPLDRWVTDLFMVDTSFLLSLVGLFSLAALLLSCVGLFAVLAESVTRRRPELGIRQALGATPRRILVLIVAQGLRVVVLGLCAGAVLAWASTRVLESTLYGVTATDPGAYLTAALVLGAAALAASLLPARAAAAVDPAEVLREE